MNTNSSQFYAYLAGFLDGDGSVYVRAKPNSSYRYGYQISPYIAFFQSASSGGFRAMVEKVGYGKIRLRKDGIFEFTINKQAEIKDFLEKVSPYLQLKQQQALLMIDILEYKQTVANEKDFAELLVRVDRFRELNYSKNRKIRQ